MRLLCLILFFLITECFDIAAITTMTRSFNRIAPHRYDHCVLRAAIEGEERKVKDFVELGGNVNVRGGNGITPLIGATERGHENIVRYLLDQQCDINAYTTEDNFTALLLASLKDYENIAEILIKQGANVNLANKEGDSPLIFAVNNNNIRLVRSLILNGANMNHKNNQGLTPMAVALSCFKNAKEKDKPDWEEMLALLICLNEIKFIR